MTFMYLHLEYKTREEARNKIFGEGLWATIRNDGKTPRSIGTENSKHSNSPLGVFQLQGFDGIECISEEELIEELLRRTPLPELMQRMAWEVSTEDLILMIARRNNVRLQKMSPSAQQRPEAGW